MSLYSALFSGVTGLTAESAAMASVADNITNINTVGYKAVDSQFSTLVGGVGEAGRSYQAGGVTSVSKTLISKQGLLGTSASPTDLGIAGTGFFITRDSNTPDAAVTLTRAGSFSPDKEGFLRNSAGLYLQGWRLDANGEYENSGTVEAMEPVRISDLTGTTTPTTKIQMQANFQNTTTAFVGTYVVGDMARGGEHHFQRSIDVYDQQGSPHRVMLSVLKTGPNTWQGELYAQPKTDVTQTDGLLASGVIKFNGDGSLNLTDSGTGMFGSITPAWTNGAGSKPIDLQFGSNGLVDGFTQTGSTDGVGLQSIDGGVTGNATISVSETGVVSALFDDGTLRKVFQLPMATVSNPDGLTRTNGNGFIPSDQSGSYSIGTPGTANAGKIKSFALEASTADLATEFTNMIRFQRAYSAASKIITTVDDMLQEVSNLKR